MFNEICESLLNMHENLLRIDEKVDSLIEMQEQTSKVYDQIIETTKQADLAMATKGKLVGYGEMTALFGK